LPFSAVEGADWFSKTPDDVRIVLRLFFFKKLGEPLPPDQREFVTSVLKDVIDISDKPYKAGEVPTTVKEVMESLKEKRSNEKARGVLEQVRQSWGLVREKWHLNIQPPSQTPGKK
jgi:hypothetical protein